MGSADEPDISALTVPRDPPGMQKMHVPRLLPGLLSLLFAAVPTQLASARDHLIVADTSGSLWRSVSGKGQPVSGANPARIAGAKNILADGTDSLSEYNSRRSLDDERGWPT